MKVQRRAEGENTRNLEEIKVIEDEKHGQNDIDNHADQNYNIKHF
jgi:hypothetical protein